MNYAAAVRRDVSAPKMVSTTEHQRPRFVMLCIMLEIDWLFPGMIQPLSGMTRDTRRL